MTTNFTNNIESDESIKEDTNHPNPTHDYCSIRKKSMFLLSDEDIWKNSSSEGNENEKEGPEERAKSENKFDDCETVYSHSLK
jgi:hypothetical protein